MLREESIRAMHSLFHTGEGGSIPTSSLDLRVGKIKFARALELNGLWHSTLPRMGTGFIANQPFLCFVATHEDWAYAVAIWSNPVARNLPQTEWLELRRYAISGDSPRNTASRMLRIMAMMIRRERPEVQRLVSYQDIAAHAGTIYKAAGWTMTSISAGGDWDRPSRARPTAQRGGAKQRWEKSIRA